MSIFMSKTTPLTVFRAVQADVTLAKLRQYTFMPIDNIKSEKRAFGWVNFDDMMDLNWHSSPEKGEFFAFALRIDTRTVKPALLKKHIHQAYQNELEKIAAEGRQSIPMVRKKELREQVQLLLLTQTEPSPIAVDVVFDTRSSLVYVSSASNSIVELFKEHWLLSFGGLLEEACYAGLESQSDNLAESLAMESFLSEIYAQSLSLTIDGVNFEIAEDGVLTLAQEDGRTVTVKNEPGASTSAMEAGLYIKNLKICLTRQDTSEAWSFSLGSSFRFTGLKSPEVSKSDNGNCEVDADATFFEKMHLLVMGVRVMHALFKERWS